MSQADLVVKHINQWGSINSLEAIGRYGITRLARVIHDLKGTPDQMKAVEDPMSAQGFVKYVPDIEGRKELIFQSHIKALGNPNVSLTMKIQSCLDAASVLTALKQEGL